MKHCYIIYFVILYLIEIALHGGSKFYVNYIREMLL